MLLKRLREEVLDANLELVRKGLVLYTFGNASGVDREQGLVVIKPSGVDYDDLRPEHMVVTDLEGKIVEGKLKPSSDLDTHTLLYREFPTIGAVVHTHSEYATSFAQAGMAIPAFGTTHADYFHGPVPVSLPLNDEAIRASMCMRRGWRLWRGFKGMHGDRSDGGAGVPGGRACSVCVGEGRRHDAAHNAVVLEYWRRWRTSTLTLKASASGDAGAAGSALLAQAWGECYVWAGLMGGDDGQGWRG